MQYFFDIIDQNGTTPDTEGMELSGLEQVRREATRALAEFAAEDPHRTDVVKLAIGVRDENDREVYRINLHIEGRAAPRRRARISRTPEPASR